MPLRTSEWVALAYFAFLMIAAFVRPIPPARRWRVLLAGMAVAALAIGLARVGADTRFARDWAPLLYLLLGYWTPALLVIDTNTSLQRALARVDRRWLGAHPASKRLPRPIGELLELAYLFCYALMPIGMLCLERAGFRAEADRFWTAVLVAGFASYGPLPWLASVPPRALEPPLQRLRIRWLNAQVLAHASVRLNTFPSGHAASSLATALAVASVLPTAGLALGVAAIGVSLGSVAGRYHYAADVASGLGVGVAAFAISRLVGFV